jgi:hypothetical protein
MKQQPPFQAYDKGEGQHDYAGYAAHVAVTRHCLLEIQFGHDMTPIVWDV